jgi:hypothetical protein
MRCQPKASGWKNRPAIALQFKFSERLRAHQPALKKLTWNP